MRFVVAFTIVLALACFCSRAIKKAPTLLYALAIALDALYAYGMVSGAVQGASTGFWAAYIPFMQRCTLAFACFTVVMFTGVLKEGSRAKLRLMGIRRQLSIAGCILTMCHVIHYGYAYFVQMAGGVRVANIKWTLGISIVLLVLFTVLLVTSFNAVKRRMHTKTWKRIQRWAYAFYGLMLVHLAIVLLPPAADGKNEPLTSMIVYAMVFAAYAALRTRRALLDRKDQVPNNQASA